MPNITTLPAQRGTDRLMVCKAFMSIPEGSDPPSDINIYFSTFCPPLAHIAL